MSDTRYKQYGFNSREEYLKDVAASTGFDEDTVFAVADMLGPSEDFDGLINCLNDAQEETI